MKELSSRVPSGLWVRLGHVTTQHDIHIFGAMNAEPVPTCSPSEPAGIINLNGDPPLTDKLRPNGQKISFDQPKLLSVKIK